MTNTEKYALEHFKGDMREAIKYLAVYGDNEDRRRCVPEWSDYEKQYAKDCLLDYYRSTMTEDEFLNFMYDCAGGLHPGDPLNDRKRKREEKEKRILQEEKEREERELNSEFNPYKRKLAVNVLIILAGLAFSIAAFITLRDSENVIRYFITALFAAFAGTGVQGLVLYIKKYLKWRDFRNNL